MLRTDSCLLCVCACVFFSEVNGSLSFLCIEPTAIRTCTISVDTLPGAESSYDSVDHWGSWFDRTL